MESEQLLCRTCLASDVNLYKLDEPVLGSLGDLNAHTISTSSFADCLYFCTRLEIMSNFPSYICEECSHALQISYFFIQNAIKAHEILVQRLGIVQEKQKLDNEKINDEETPMRFRCKICHEKVLTKKALKEHIKLHLDVITFCCQLCDFDCKKRSQLSDHYLKEHNKEATNDQLKPYMEPGAKIKERECEIEQHIDEILIPSEQRQREQEEAEMLLQELEEKLFKEKQDEVERQKKFALTNEEINSQAKIIMPNSMDVVNSNYSPISVVTIAEHFENDANLGNEFVVLPDGTMQKVVGSDVVIEYINENSNQITVLDGNHIVIENVVQIDPNNATFDAMDFEDIIEEATAEFHGPAESQEEFQVKKAKIQLSKERIIQPMVNSKNVEKAPKKTQCKICTKAFQTQLDLKTHMLGHNEIPHFFCDRCSFYTFFKTDLKQHYRTKHNIQPSQRQLQPTNKPEPLTGRAIYACDLCLYETTIQLNLRRHYKNEHCVEATEVQLRPTIDNTDVDIKSFGNGRKNKVEKTEKKSDDNLKCKICHKQFLSLNILQKHLIWHENDNFKKEGQQPPSSPPPPSTSTALPPTTPPPLPTPQSQQYTEVTVSSSNPLESKNNNIDSETVLPMDAVPQVIGSEQTIEHTTDFDFNGDEIFEDFAENSGNIGDCKDNEDLGNLCLTSEDDLDDLLEEHGTEDKINDKPRPAPQLRAYCVHCNKRFFSQYHFENHMFIHRGLAPYRCEMCTNLYNTKRALIRHYKAVHKTIPTRDMIQAKGDKLNVENAIAQMNAEGTKRSTLMCAKCPFESNDLNNLLMHLGSSHGVTDDNYILQKLPFECPRCIRSYDSKESLTLHLERNHSSVSILQKVPRRTSSKKSSTSDTFRMDAMANATVINTESTGTRNGIIETSSHFAVIAQQEVADKKDAAAWLENNLMTRVSSSLNSNEVKTQGTMSLFECAICQGRYKSQALLRHHFKRHVERKFLCNLCPKSFICCTELKKHKLLHNGQMTGEMPYKCDMCYKQFGYPHHLKRHKDVAHFGKRYNCPVPSCRKSFTTKAQRNVHTLAHSGNQPYKCKICNRLFCKRETFRQHSRKAHNVNLTEAEIAEVFRVTTGHMNPHDLMVALDNGQLLRRSEAEAVNLGTSDIAYNENSLTVSNLS